MLGVKFGGGENFDWNLAIALREQGVSVRMLTGKRVGKAPPREPPFQTSYFLTPYLRKYMYRYEFQSFKILRAFGYFCSSLDLLIFQSIIYCWFVVRRPKVDAVQLCGLPLLGAWLAKQGHHAVVRWPGPPSKKNRSRMTDYAFNVANGDAYRQIVKQSLAKNIVNINVGLDFTHVSAKSIYKSRARSFCFAGRIVPIKNLPLLIAAFGRAKKSVPGITLDIIGDGEPAEESRCQNLASNLGLTGSVVFKKAQTRRQLFTSFEQADCFVLSSHYDNYPNVLLEAMACGLPVISTDVGGVGMIVEDQVTGLLVQAGSETRLADAMVALATSSGLGESLGQNAARRAANGFSWTTTASSFLKLYNAKNE